MMQKHRVIKVLFAVWELEPFFKVGGLGEVAYSLPRALKEDGVDIRVILPYYKALKLHGSHRRVLGTVSIKYGKKVLKFEVSRVKFLNAAIPVYLLNNKEYFDKLVEGTFAVFAGVVIELLKSKILGSWVPDIVHCNDYHCGLIPLLLKLNKIDIRTLLTIHCVSHQRRSPASIATNLGIPKEKLNLMMWETRDKQFNFLLEGIKHADYVNTVSPTYLKEIQTEEYGAELDEIIRSYKSKTSAILNGIDYENRNPATNSALRIRYSADSEPFLAKKANKSLLQEKFGLPVRSDVTVIGYVGRLIVNQKGIDILHRMLWREQFKNCQFVILGHGEEAWEERFTTLSAFLPESVATCTKYDDITASIIYAGSDFVLIPSIFEPCCLIQMNAMRYGAIPIARATGGLNDTIVDGRNGILYGEPTSFALREAIKRALELKKRSIKRHHAMVKEAMKTDFSWVTSAKKYIDLYRKMITN